MQSIKLAWLNVLRNRRRSMFTMLITMVATVVLLAGGGFCLYMYQGLAEDSARETGHLVLSKPEFFAADEDFPLQYGLPGYRELQQRYQADPQIRAVLPQIEFQGLISNGDKTLIFTGKGVEYNEFQVRGPFITFTAGQALSGQPIPGQPHEILLASGLAQNLKVQVGDIVTLLSTTTDNMMNGIDFQVRGIFSASVPELNKRLIYTHLAAAQELVDSQLVSTVAIHLFEDADSLHQQQQLQQHHPELAVTPWWKLAFYYKDVKNLFDRIFGLLGLIVVLMVFLAISNTMSMAVMERTREIGTLAAMGAYPAEIIRGFVLEGLIVGLLGTLSGVLVNLLLFVCLTLIDIQMPPPPGSTTGFPVAINLSWLLTLTCTLVLTVTCAVAAWLAARNGCRKPVTEALAYV
jgi:putative ABC transport system permease protein